MRLELELKIWRELRNGLENANGLLHDLRT
jgi:hypothetical protein